MTLVGSDLAILVARSGAERCGASRCGFTPKETVVDRDGGGLGPFYLWAETKRDDASSPGGETVWTPFKE